MVFALFQRRDLWEDPFQRSRQLSKAVCTLDNRFLLAQLPVRISSSVFHSSSPCRKRVSFGFGPKDWDRVVRSSDAGKVLGATDPFELERSASARPRTQEETPKGLPLSSITKACAKSIFLESEQAKEARGRMTKSSGHGPAKW